MHGSDKTIARDLGSLIHIPGILAIPTLFVAAFAKEWFAVPGLILLIILSISLGQLLYHYGKSATESIPTLPLIVAAIAWLVIALLGAIPIYGAALLNEDPNQSTLAFRDPLNALFESMSGFTSTGLTVAIDPSELPRTLQWWRSLSQWVGAIGVVVLALMIIEPRENAYQLYEAEARTDHIANDPKTTVRRIWEIYIFYTLVTVIAYLFAGMHWWEAINHGLTAIGTGGFTIMPDSFQGYGAGIKLITIVIIILGAISFQVHHALLRHADWRFVVRHTQMRVFAVLLAAGMMLLALVNRLAEPDIPFIDTAFQWTTALGTAGFDTVDLVEWSQPALVLLTVAMIVGGTAGSTVGGLKIIRIAWLVKAFGWQFHRTWAHEEIPPKYHFNGQTIEESKALRSIKSTVVMSSLWLVILGAGSLILMLLMVDEREFHEVLFEVASALGNVGLGVGISEPDLHPAGRLTLIALMWMGRLEIMGVIILLTIPLGLRWRRRHAQ